MGTNSENRVKRFLPLVLFSGMAADADVFVGQKVAFEQLVVPNWPVPLANESMDAYAKRLADELKRADIQILGGASFGGIIAMYVAQYLKPRAVLLIGSVASPSELPRYVRWLRPLRFAVRWLPIGLMQVLAVPLTANVLKKLVPSLCGLARQFARCDASILRWSMEQVLIWKTAPRVGVPVFHIHGDRDWLLPLKYTNADRVVHGGGHLISITHATQVNGYVREVMRSCGQSSFTPEAIQ